jgi:hypothetical protein
VKYPRYISKDDIQELKLEVISQELRVYLARLLDNRMADDEGPEEVKIIQQNKLINRARNLQGLPLYVLNGDDYGNFQPAEHAWHNGEFEILFRRLSTIQFIEFLCDLIEWGALNIAESNVLFDEEGLSFRITGAVGELVVDVFPIGDLEANAQRYEHVNIRYLAKRMDDAFRRDDFAGVLLASSHIFETMAKDIVGIPTVQNETLKGFFDRYRKDSGLPAEILDYILSIYNARNTTPLAGHGSTQTPNLTKETAIILRAMTIAFVSIEYALRAEIQGKPKGVQ